MNKKIIYMLIAIIILSIGLGVFFVLKEKNKAENNVEEQQGLKINTNNTKIVDGEKVNIDIDKSMQIENLTLTNIILQTEQDTCKFTADVLNKATEKFIGGTVVIAFRDKNGTIISFMETIIPEIQPGESTKINTATTADVVNASNVTIEIVKNEM